MSQGERLRERHLAARSQVLKKKGCSWGRNPKSVDVQVARERKANDESLTMNKRILQRMKMCSH
jgi:hypothetical protein